MWASGFEEAIVVEDGVDKGDVEAMEMEEFCEFEHGVYVALCWVWDAHSVWFLC